MCGSLLVTKTKTSETKLYLMFKGPSQPQVWFGLHAIVWLLSFTCALSKRKKNRYKITKDHFASLYDINNLKASKMAEADYRYLLLAEFEIGTVSYVPSFPTSRYHPSAKRANHKSKGKNKDPQLTVRTKKRFCQNVTCTYISTVCLTGSRTFSFSTKRL